MPKRRLKKPRAKTARIVGSYRTDVSLALQWARSNKAITSASAVKEVDGRYVANVKVKKSKSSLKDLLKDRFGVFISVI